MSNNTRRNICVVITARPSYSRVKTALEAIQQHPELNLQLVVAASALLDRYGNAFRYIEEDGFKIEAKVFNVLEGENLQAQAKTTGLGILELTTVFEHLKPDAVVTVADRFETMATAIAASYMNIPLVHIQGGEVTGNIDEKVRHAITKLSDLHLVASKEACDRVLRMGEDPDYVIVTGCPSLDLAKRIAGESNNQSEFDPVKKYGGVGISEVDLDHFIVVLQHPVTTQYDEARKQVEITLEAIHQMGIPCLWFWPNVDAGSDGTSKGIRAFREKHTQSKIHFFKNMEPEDFLRLLKKCKCLVGNSSAGIRECSFLGIPVVNIGQRQQGRARGRNVVDVQHDVLAIRSAVENQIRHGHYEPEFIYGNGQAGVQIANALAKSPLRFEKKIQY
ncbi:MAG: UDP-N-acetylglucosamine 2-epimerase (hydrolyzing) [Saprospiraceae bacterium]|nr:UDP-N-acetylglucosamine 2-epimerase (hydrolyzing) [Saprospiraceae bacterium]